MALSRKVKIIWAVVALPLILGSYICTILWRVSIAEQDLYGRSCLIPVSLQRKPTENELGTATTFWDNSYSFNQHGKIVHVHSQLVNGFQHAYGSALAAFELGVVPADLLFRANEYAEATFSGRSGSQPFYLDARKDLSNNAFGRAIGDRARKLGLSGAPAEKYMKEEVVRALVQGQVFSHWRDERVPALPSLEEYGCPALSQVMETHGNIFRIKDKMHVQ
jgi:hypothetical protein